MSVAQRITRIIDFFYIGPVRKLISPQTFRYVVCGGANLLLGWIIYYLVFNFIVRENWLDLGWGIVMSPAVQTLFIQFPITFFTGFWLNRNVTFTQSVLRGRVQLFRYAVSVGGSFLLKWLLLKLFVYGLGLYAPLANPMADGIVVIYSYLMARFFTFRSPRGEKEEL